MPLLVEGRSRVELHMLLCYIVQKCVLRESDRMHCHILSVLAFECQIPLHAGSPHSLVECIHAQHVLSTARFVVNHAGLLWLTRRRHEDRLGWVLQLASGQSAGDQRTHLVSVLDAFG